MFFVQLRTIFRQPTRLSAKTSPERRNEPCVKFKRLFLQTQPMDVIGTEESICRTVLLVDAPGNKSDDNSEWHSK